MIGRRAALRCVVASAGPSLDDERLLDAAERRRAARIVRAADRARFATGRALARRVLGAELGCEPAEIALPVRCASCGGEDHGKPGAPGGLELSIAHAAERVVVAVALGRAVGVDVEPVDPGAVDPAVLSPSERRALEAVAPLERPRAFAVLWTRREALVKALGSAVAFEHDCVVASGPMAIAEIDLGDGYVGHVAARTARDLALVVRCDETP